jgi:hypothetical protein
MTCASVDPPYPSRWADIASMTSPSTASTTNAEPGPKCSSCFRNWVGLDRNATT